MKTTNRKNSHLIPYPIIVEACSGNAEAIDVVLKHYDGYISRLATRPMIDDRGVYRIGVDEEIRDKLKTALINKILNFKLA